MSSTPAPSAESVSPVGSTLAPPGGWDAVCQLEYRKQCQEMLLVLGQKFVSLVGQSAVFATTASGALVTAEDALDLMFPETLLVALPAIAGLGVYWWFGMRYLRQVRETGTLIYELEGVLFSDPETRLLGRLRQQRNRLYGHTLTTIIAWGLWPSLMLMIVLAALTPLMRGAR